MSHRTHAQKKIIDLESRFPVLAEFCTALRQVLNVTRSFDFPEFTEPKTLLFGDESDKIEVDVNADLVAAWICHMSHSSRIRMELLEDAAINAMMNSELIAAAILTRGHMEAAAWAAYTNEELIKASDTGSWGKLKRLIPRMLHGSAIAREKKSIPPDGIHPFLLEPSSIMNAIDALDRFFGTVRGIKTQDSRVLYAILSDYAHPTIGGVRHLLEAVSENEYGWVIRYSQEENIDSTAAKVLLGALLQNMRLGHAAAILMRLGIIEETESGINYCKPSINDGAGVWQYILQGELPQKPKKEPQHDAALDGDSAAFHPRL